MCPLLGALNWRRVSALRVTWTKGIARWGVRCMSMAVDEAGLEEFGPGLAPVSPGWFVVNVRDAAWVRRALCGRCVFQSDRRVLRDRPDLDEQRNFRSSALPSPCWSVVGQAASTTPNPRKRTS